MSENDRNGQESRQNVGGVPQGSRVGKPMPSSDARAQAQRDRRVPPRPRSASGQSTGTARKSSGTSGQTCIGTASVTRAATRSGGQPARGAARSGMRRPTPQRTDWGAETSGAMKVVGKVCLRMLAYLANILFDDTAHRRCRRNNNGLCVPILCQ